MRSSSAYRTKSGVRRSRRSSGLRRARASTSRRLAGTCMNIWRDTNRPNMCCRPTFNCARRTARRTTRPRWNSQSARLESPSATDRNFGKEIAMSALRPRTELETHEVINQPPPFEDVNLFTSDVVLQEVVAHAGGASHRERLAAFGTRAGSAEVAEWAMQANRN